MKIRKREGKKERIDQWEKKKRNVKIKKCSDTERKTMRETKRKREKDEF